jgi:hypothetical protein
MYPDLNLHGSKLELAKRVYVPPAEAVAKLLHSFASGVCALHKLHAWIHGLYPVWSFAHGKTPEVIAAMRQLLSPAKPSNCPPSGGNPLGGFNGLLRSHSC